MINGKVGAVIVVGAQHGDEGKGKISVYLTRKLKAKMIVRAGVGPNAEHGIYPDGNDKYVCVNQLPLGFIYRKEAKIRIGPGTCVDPDKLFKEMHRFGISKQRVRIDPRCFIVLPEHIKWERKHLKNNSTYNGCGACMSQAVLRRAIQARNVPSLKRFLIDVPNEVNKLVDRGIIVVESSQGTMLSRSLSMHYPHTTSKNVTAVAAMDDVGLNWQKVKAVVLVVKTMPTRESHGPMTSDELSLEEIKKRGLVEYSSIGGEIRRKSKGINFKDLLYAVQVNGATEIVLTFCDHYSPEMRDIKDVNMITEKVWRLVRKVQKLTGVPVTMLETGKGADSIIDIRGVSKY